MFLCLIPSPQNKMSSLFWNWTLVGSFLILLLLVSVAISQCNTSSNSLVSLHLLPLVIGSHYAPYGRKALDVALDKLYGFYRTSKVLWLCQDWRDWDSMTLIFDLEKQWSQALKFALKALMEQPGHGLAARSKAGNITDNYLQ